MLRPKRGLGWSRWHEFTRKASSEKKFAAIVRTKVYTNSQVPPVQIPLYDVEKKTKDEYLEKKKKSTGIGRQSISHLQRKPCRAARLAALKSLHPITSRMYIDLSNRRAYFSSRCSATRPRWARDSSKEYCVTASICRTFEPNKDQAIAVNCKEAQLCRFHRQSFFCNNLDGRVPPLRLV